MGFESPFGIRRKIRNNYVSRQRKKGNKKDDISVAETEGLPSDESSIENLTPTEFKELKIDAKNNFNLAQLYSNMDKPWDKPKSRDYFLRSIECQEKVLAIQIHRDVDESVRNASLQQLATINEKLAELEISMNLTSDAINRYSTAMKHYNSITDSFKPTVTFTSTGKKEKVSTKKESLARLKDTLLELDPSYVFSDSFHEEEEPVVAGLPIGCSVARSA